MNKQELEQYEEKVKPFNSSLREYVYHVAKKEKNMRIKRCFQKFLAHTMKLV